MTRRDVLAQEDALSPIADVGALRKLYGQFPTGVTAVAALRDGNPIGFAASSFNTVSADPPLVALCVQDTSTTWPLIAESARIGISVLGAEQAQLCRQLASRGDRFDGVDWTSSAGGAIFIDEASAWLECVIHSTSTVGDHELVILEVVAQNTNPAIAPLAFQGSRFHELRPLLFAGAAPQPPATATHAMNRLELGWW